jgi:hypothetical protein
VLPFPFHFLNNNHAMNVRPKNYKWTEFYDRLIDLTKYSFSWKTMTRRARGTQRGFATWVNFMRGVSSEGFGRIKYHSEIRRRLDEDRPLRAFFDGETAEIPAFYVDRVKRELGPLWPYLPEGALVHDPLAYSAKTDGELVTLSVPGMRRHEPVRKAM